MGSRALTHRDNGRNGSSSPNGKSKTKQSPPTSGHRYAAVSPDLKPLAARQPTPVVQLMEAGAGDHYAAHQLLLNIFQQPSPAEFQAQLDEPFYEPSQRLLVKHTQRVVAHLRMLPREMHFGSAVFPATGLTELATDAEFRRRGFASALIAEAEKRMQADGAVLGFVRTSSPGLFERAGWVAWGRHSFSLAGTREVLAQLNVEDEAREIPATNFAAPQPKHLPLSTRIWRHVEQAALVRLYQAGTDRGVGSLVRTHDFWHWLICRHGYEQIYAVIEGRDRLDLDESRVVGYAVTKPGRIVEMMTDPTRPRAAIELLKRVCGDFIERDIHSLRYDGPPSDPMHRLFVNAGGEFRHREVENGHKLMAKMLDRRRFLDLLSPQILERARLADVSLPLELGVQCGDEKWQLVVSRRSVKQTHGKLGRHSLKCDAATLAQLLLGQLDLVAAAAEKRLEFSSRTAAEHAAILFPRLNIWRPPFDELPA